MANWTKRPLVVMLHSSASSSRQWDWLADVLSAHYRVATLDFHGHGAMAAWAGREPLSLADDAALVGPLLAEADDVHLVGHSYGAAVALKVAEAHPTSIRSVVAFEPVLFRLLIDWACHRAAQEIGSVADAVFTLVKRGEHHAAAERFVDFWAGGPAWKSMSQPKQDGVAMRMPTVSQHFGALMREPALRLARLARLPMPALYLQGQQTVGPMRTLMELLKSAIPAARHETLPAMGHMGPLTHADAFNRRVVDFIGGQRARRSLLAGWASTRPAAAIGQPCPG